MLSCKAHARQHGDKGDGVQTLTRDVLKAAIRALTEHVLDARLVVIEDCAQSLGSKHKDKYVGTWSHVGCCSFDVGELLSAGTF